MQESKGELTTAKLATFLTLPGEQLMIAKRQHWFILAVPMIGTVFFAFFINALILLTFFIAFPSFILLIGSILLTVNIVLHCVIKEFVDWYFHFYIVTNRKILEINYSPLSKQTINDVFLDQVRCTEIDIRTKGVIQEMFDMGDIIITFDRPTHEEEFILSGLHDPKTTGTFLGDMLETIMPTTTSVWYKQRNNPSRFQFVEEIFPKIAGNL